MKRTGFFIFVAILAVITRICSGVNKADAEKYINNVKITEKITIL